MVTKLVTGIDGGCDSASAATAAVRRAKEKLGGRRIDLSMVYSSSEYDHRNVVDAVREATKNAPLIGASSGGVFTEEGVMGSGVAVSLLSSDDIKVFTALSEGVKDDPEAAIKKITAKLPDNVDGYPHLTAIALIDGLSGVGEEITLLASYLFGRRLGIVGGMAGDDFRMERTFVFSDDSVCTNALSVCLLASKMPLATGVAYGHTPMSGALKATATSGNVLREINGKPAWEVWKAETRDAAGRRGIDVNRLKTPSEIAQFFANYILGLATEKEGEYKIRWPISINEDSSLNFTCCIAEDASFRIMDGSNPEDQINVTAESVRMAKESARAAGYSEFAGVVVFECVVRRLVLGDQFFESVDRIKKALHNAPLLGWGTYGEIQLDSGKFSGFHNATSVALLLPDCNGLR